MTRIERPIREWLRRWEPWMFIAYCVLAALIVGIYVTLNRTAHEEAIRAATARSAAAAQVTQCMASAKSGPVAKGFIEAHEALIANSVDTTQAALKVAAPHDPLTPIRIQSLRRLFAAERNAEQLDDLIKKGTPSVEKCEALAVRLHVPPQPSPSR